MKRLLVILSCTVLFGLITGCGPMHSAAGNTCLDHCMNAKSNCEQMCHKRHKACCANAKHGARHDHHCHSACGGKVLERKECVALCNQQQ